MEGIRELLDRVWIYVVTALLVVPVVILYFYLGLISIAEDMDGIFPTGLTLDHWIEVLDGRIPIPGAEYEYPNIYLVALNTFILAVLVAGLEVVISSLAGYSLSRFKFRGRSAILTMILILHAFPGITLLIALFFVLNYLGLYNSLIGVVLVKVALDLPLGIWIMKGFFDGVSWDMEMSALVDGCTRLGAWWRVVMPNVRNGLMAVLIFGFLSGWAEFIYAQTFIAEQRFWTFSMLVYAFTTGEYSYTNPGITAAVAIIYMIPVILFFLFAQKYLLRIQLIGKGGA